VAENRVVGKVLVGTIVSTLPFGLRSVNIEELKMEGNAW